MYFISIEELLRYCANTIEQLIQKVFPQIVINYKSRKWLSERSILAEKKTTNNDVNQSNVQFKKNITGESYKSIDSAVNNTRLSNRVF